MSPRAIMVLGTSSHVGKSLIAAALCRLLSRVGLKVAPFKAQNMSNNAAVAANSTDSTWGEIGRAQALQALACRRAAETDMNPVLLKPLGESRTQVILHGKVLCSVNAEDYHQLAPELWSGIAEAYDRLAANSDVVVIEGAGSCAELNIPWDLANLRMARHAKAECLLVGDIDRGGIFAQLIGTLDLLDPGDRARFVGTIINKFRGERRLLDSALRILDRRTGLPVTGVIPHIPDLFLDEEDSVGIADKRAVDERDAVEVAVLRLARISNDTDMTPLRAEPDITIRYVAVERAEPIGQCDVVIVPGTKNTPADSTLLNEGGYFAELARLAENGVEIIGLCGGLQILGRRIGDPNGIESVNAYTQGAGLLDIETILEPAKITRPARGRDRDLDVVIEGYEIHAGRTEGRAPVLQEDENGSSLGYGDGRIWGTYLHGIFDHEDFRHAWLRRCRRRKGLAPERPGRAVYSPDRELDRLAGIADEALTLPESWLSGPSSDVR